MTQRDHDGRRRSGVWLPDECWDWLDRTSARDGASRSDLLEGLVLLAMDEYEEQRRRDADRQELILARDYGVRPRPQRLDHCRPDEDYHSTPHKGCILR